MVSLFESIYPDKRPVSASEIQFMLKLFQQDLKTGLLEISYSPEDKILLLINTGKISCAYLADGDQTTRYPLSDLPELFQGRNQGVIRVCELSPAFLGALRTILEQNRTSTTLSSSTAALSGLIRKWQTMPEPSLIHIRWPNAEGFAFIPGNHFSARQYAFVAEGSPSDSAAAVSMFSRWSESECVISHYTGNADLEIWKENNLQLGFALLLEHSLRRYDELAGHSLSVKLEDSLNRLCQAHSWNISIANTSVDDVQIFETISDAALAYRAIFDLASRHISQVIGSGLFNETVEMGLAGLSGQLRQAVETNDLVAILSVSLIRG